jgi:hypothetical protein
VFCQLATKFKYTHKHYLLHFSALVSDRLAMQVLCDVCGSAPAAVLRCTGEAALCSACDRRVHRADKRRRIPLVHPCGDDSTAAAPLCDVCKVTVSGASISRRGSDSELLLSADMVAFCRSGGASCSAWRIAPSCAPIATTPSTAPTTSPPSTPASSSSGPSSPPRSSTRRPPPLTTMMTTTTSPSPTLPPPPARPRPIAKKLFPIVATMTNPLFSKIYDG